MNASIKIAAGMLDEIRQNLSRQHEFAHERIGFIIGACAMSRSGIIILARKYLAVADQDYERADGVGAQIGSDAIRKVLQAGYRPQSALLHVHTHGGRGVPTFSGTDTKSAYEFVPSFFNTLPKMPHGILVLSNNAAAGLIWLSPDKRAVAVHQLKRIGPACRPQWSDR